MGANTIPNTVPYTPFATTGGLKAISFPNWRKKLANVLAGGGFAKVLCIGDSTTYGSGTGGSANPPGPGGSSYPSRLQQLLNALSGVPAAIGLSVPCTSIVDTRWSYGAWTGGVSFGGWASLGYATGASGVANDLTFTPGINVDTFDIYYLQLAGLGTFKVAVDGAASGGATTVNTSGATGIQKVTVPVAAGSGHVLHIGSVTVNQVSIVGVDAYLSTTPAIRVGNPGIPGTSSLQWADNNLGIANAPLGSLASIIAYAPDLSIIFLAGINEGLQNVTFPQHQSAILNLIAACKLSGDVILMTSIPSQPAGNANSLAIEAASAAYYPGLCVSQNVGLVDIYNRWQPPTAYNTNGYYGGDAYHASPIGYADIAEAVALSVLRAVA